MGIEADSFGTEDFKCIECKCLFTVWGKDWEEYDDECQKQFTNLLECYSYKYGELGYNAKEGKKRWE